MQRLKSKSLQIHCFGAVTAAEATKLHSASCQARSPQESTASGRGSRGESNIKHMKKTHVDEIPELLINIIDQ
jgi:hypothetical protein